MSDAKGPRLPMNVKNTNNKVIKCQWHSADQCPGIGIARLVDRSSGIEGVDINRIRCSPGATLVLSQADGHILSVLSGAAMLESPALAKPLSIRAGTHLYIPPGYAATLRFSRNSSGVHASSGEEFARGERLLLHDEQFLSAARFVLTPQYLSRRAFLHRDETLISKSGHPIAWFHTTMFDTRGLPANRDGLAVFKMSYDHQSEINVIYEVSRSAKVRFARHPYVSTRNQLWSKWAELDKETAYHLNESSNGDEVETTLDPHSGKLVSLRNRHEIYVEPQGHVSLCCMFDPGPTGIETHLPGEYSAYTSAHDIVGTAAYDDYLKQVQPLDEMIQALSMAIATAPDGPLHESNHWVVFKSAQKYAEIREQKMIKKEAAGRESIIEPWRTRAA